MMPVAHPISKVTELTKVSTQARPKTQGIFKTENHMESSAHGSPPAKFSLLDLIPEQMVLMLASPYLAGKTDQEAIACAHRVYREDRFASTIDILGEDSEDPDECDRAVAMYRQLIDGISKNPITSAGPHEQRQQATISIKPSMFSECAPQAPGRQSRETTIKLDKAFERILNVVDYALEKKLNITLEAEDHRWTDFHLNAYFSLIKAGYTNCGTVLQTRLFRTKDDIKKFDERMRVRLVIGIYNEPREIALTEKPQMKDLLVTYAQELLKKGTYVELATHDTACIDKFVKNVVVPYGIPATEFETQFLLGVPRKKLQEDLVSGAYYANLLGQCQAREKQSLESLAERGTVVRMYLPFGVAHLSAAYCRRRLKANPNLAIYGIKNLLHMQ
jgi:proline dehydrogenase